MQEPRPRRYLTGMQTRQRYGGKSATWLWRHITQDPHFPTPVRIGGRPHFDEAALDEYDELMRSKSAA